MRSEKSSEISSANIFFFREVFRSFYPLRFYPLALSEKKAHKLFSHKLSVPPFGPGSVPGTNPGLPLGQTQVCRASTVQNKEKTPGLSQVFTEFVSGTNPVKSPGQTRGRPKTNRTKKFMFMCLFLAWISVLGFGIAFWGGLLGSEGFCPPPLQIPKYLNEFLFGDCPSALTRNSCESPENDSTDVSWAGAHCLEEPLSGSYQS